MRSKDQIIEAAKQGEMIDGGGAGGGDAEENTGDDEEPPRLPNRGDLYDIAEDVPGAPE